MSFTTPLDHLNRLRKIVLNKSRRKKYLQTFGRHCWRISDGSLSPSSLWPWKGLAYFLFTDHLLTHILSIDNLTPVATSTYSTNAKGIGDYRGKVPYLKRPFAPDFRAKIFEIVLQLPIDWLKRNLWNFYSLGRIFTQDPCGPPCTLEVS